MDAPTAAPSTDAFVAPRQRSELMLGAVPAALVLVCAAALNCRWAAPTHVVSRVTRLTATTALVAALAIPAALPFDLMLTFQARTHKPGGDELYDRWAPKLRDYYTSLFWTSYVATNLVLPISGYYLASGALSVRARLLDALRSLALRCVCLAAAASAAIGLAFATGAVSNADGLFSIEAGLASLSNATALVQIIALLGVGLVVLPVSVGAAMSVGHRRDHALARLRGLDERVFESRHEYYSEAMRALELVDAARGSSPDGSVCHGQRPAAVLVALPEDLVVALENSVSKEVAAHFASKRRTRARTIQRSEVTAQGLMRARAAVRDRKQLYDLTRLQLTAQADRARRLMRASEHPWCLSRCFTVGACALGCVLCALASATLYAGEADLLLDGLGLIHRPGVLCRIDSWGLALSSVTLTGIIGLVMMISFAYMAFAVICARLRFKASAGDAHANPTAAAARGAAFEVLPGATGGRALLLIATTFSALTMPLAYLYLSVIGETAAGLLSLSNAQSCESDSPTFSPTAHSWAPTTSPPPTPSSFAPSSAPTGEAYRVILASFYSDMLAIPWLGEHFTTVCPFFVLFVSLLHACGLLNKMLRVARFGEFRDGAPSPPDKVREGGAAGATRGV